MPYLRPRLDISDLGFASCDKVARHPTKKGPPRSYGERSSFHFLDGCLLISDGLNKELAAHRGRVPDIVERGHGVAECHAPDKRVRLNIDFELAGRPREIITADPGIYR
jgi:hypothetical protein